MGQVWAACELAEGQTSKNKKLLRGKVSHGRLQGSHPDGVAGCGGGGQLSGESSTSPLVVDTTDVLSQHGDLKVHVIAARDLPDTDNTFFNISRGDWTDPFVTVFLDQVLLCVSKPTTT